MISVKGSRNNLFYCFGQQPGAAHDPPPHGLAMEQLLTDPQEVTVRECTLVTDSIFSKDLLPQAEHAKPSDAPAVTINSLTAEHFLHRYS